MFDFNYSFFLEVLVGGLMSGVMYSLVAIGFVLVYKASNVLNFSQGAMVLFAALTFVSLLEMNIPFVLAFIITSTIMTALGFGIERMVLRPLTNRSPMALFGATLAMSYILEGAAQIIWGTQPHNLSLGIDDVLFEFGVIWLSTLDLVIAGIAAMMMVLLIIFFRWTRPGLAFRAAADDPFAALAIGLRLPAIGRTVWVAAGIVGLIAGILWGARLGVQFSLSIIVLKAIPVLVIGGFDSILGAVVGGLIIGAGEVLAEIYIGPIIGNGITDWFAYVIAFAFLLVRPSGLFGKMVVERA